VVDDLRGRGLQSDARFAEALRAQPGQSRPRPGPYPPGAGQRGIDDDGGRRGADQPAAHWLDAWPARYPDDRKFGDAPPADRDDWNRQARFLAQRGFPSDLIYRVLGNAD
jgi:regulatory protein